MVKIEATLHDSKGNEIEIPKCEKCGDSKLLVLGKESFMWFCVSEKCQREKNGGKINKF